MGKAEPKNKKKMKKNSTINNKNVFYFYGNCLGPNKKKKNCGEELNHEPVLNFLNVKNKYVGT